MITEEFLKNVRNKFVHIDFFRINDWTEGFLTDWSYEDDKEDYIIELETETDYQKVFLKDIKKIYVKENITKHIVENVTVSRQPTRKIKIKTDE